MEEENHAEEVDEIDQDGADLPEMDEESMIRLTGAVQEKIRERKSKGDQTPQRKGIIFVGHIPFGFFEPQMKAFFSQFGKVTRIKLHRNPKTGHSRHNAYIEFEDEAIANDVAAAMNNYIMYERRLICKVVPPQKIHPRMFFGSTRSSPLKRRTSERAHMIKTLTPQNRGKLVHSMVARERQRQARLTTLGIDYAFDGLDKPAKKGAAKKEGKKAKPAAAASPAPKPSPKAKAAPSPKPAKAAPSPKPAKGAASPAPASPGIQASHEAIGKSRAKKQKKGK